MSFSAIIPLFNKGPHVAAMLHSIKAQTRPAEEVIVVDDGSTDEGPEIVRAHAWDRLRLIAPNPEGKGVCAARNAAIRASAGEWIAFLDADDEWTPGHLERLDALRRDYPDVGLIFAGVENIYPDGPRPDAFAAHAPAPRGRLSFEQFLTAWIAAGRSPVYTQSVAIRRDLLFDVGLFPDPDVPRGEDIDMWLRSAARAPVAYTTEIGARYHRDAVNMATRTVSANTPPLIARTIAAMAPGAPPHTARLLKRVANLEIWNHARQALRSGGLSRDVYAGFHIAADPARYALMVIGGALPPALLARR